MPELENIRLYLFDGLPVYTDLRAERELLNTCVYARMRMARRAWVKQSGRDPRYMVYVDGVAFASSSMGRCRVCENERPRIGELVVCRCSEHAVTTV